MNNSMANSAKNASRILNDAQRAQVEAESRRFNKKLEEVQSSTQVLSIEDGTEDIVIINEGKKMGLTEDASERQKHRDVMIKRKNSNRNN